MDKRLSKDMSAAEIKSYTEAAVHNTFILGVIAKALLRIIESKSKPMSVEEYNVSNWSERYADRQGELRAYRDVLNMLLSVNKGVIDQ